MFGRVAECGAMCCGEKVTFRSDHFDIFSAGRDAFSLWAHNRSSLANFEMSQSVKFFGCRPMTTVPRTAGPAYANLHRSGNTRTERSLFCNADDCESRPDPACLEGALPIRTAGRRLFARPPLFGRRRMAII